MNNKQAAPPRGESRRTVVSRRLIPRVSLSALFLCIALFTVWLALWQSGQSIDRLNRQLSSLRNVARELRIDDPSQFAAVQKVGEWYGENVCEIHVPRDQSYRLCLALDAIDGNGFPKPLQFVSLASGEHRIEIGNDIDGDKSLVRVLIDDQAAIEEVRSKTWSAHVGTSGGFPFTDSTQYPTDYPMVLFRQRFMVSVGSPTGRKAVLPKIPGAGILVWIEPGVNEGQ